MPPDFGDILFPNKVEKPLVEILNDLKVALPETKGKVDAAADELTALAKDLRQLVARADRILTVVEAFAVKLTPAP